MKYNLKAGFTIALLTALMLSISTTGCYNDKEETLFPGSQCDSTTNTYSQRVVPILNAYCNMCHGSALPSAGIRLDTYTTVLQQVNNGRLLGSITHAPGFSPMPKNAGKLSPCDIAIIRRWINAGALNN
jgi:mono/diheme cytochrome c family protein